MKDHAAKFLFALLVAAATAGMFRNLWFFPLSLVSWYVLTPFFDWLGPRVRDARVAYVAWRIRRENGGQS